MSLPSRQSCTTERAGLSDDCHWAPRCCLEHNYGRQIQPNFPGVEIHWHWRQIRTEAFSTTLKCEHKGPFHSRESKVWKEYTPVLSFVAFSAGSEAASVLQWSRSPVHQLQALVREVLVLCIFSLQLAFICSHIRCCLFVPVLHACLHLVGVPQSLNLMSQKVPCDFRWVGWFKPILCPLASCYWVAAWSGSGRGSLSSLFCSSPALQAVCT